MTKEALISQMFQILSKLPEDKIREVSDFADFLLKRQDEYEIQEGMKSMVNESKSFDFLKEEKDLYSEDDLKKKYK